MEESHPTLVQIHCHHHAVIGTDCERKVLDRIGLEYEIMKSGCCGMAGSFGFERNKYDVSIAAAERVLLPTIRSAPPDTIILGERLQLPRADRAMHWPRNIACRRARRREARHGGFTRLLVLVFRGLGFGLEEPEQGRRGASDDAEKHEGYEVPVGLNHEAAHQRAERGGDR
jgi:hypothetical protein